MTMLGTPEHVCQQCLPAGCKEAITWGDLVKPTWRAVVKVVADPAGGDNHALALSIAEQHQGNS